MNPSQMQTKLERDLLRWLVSAEVYTSWRAYRVYSVYFWLGELFVLLVGLGFSHPMFRILAPNTQEAAGGNNMPIIASLGEGIMFVGALTGLTVWGLMKIYVTQNNLQKIFELIRSARRQLGEIYLNLEDCLDRPNPLPKLVEAQGRIREIIVGLNREDALPWNNGVAPGIEKRVSEEASRLVAQFSPQWTQLPANPLIQQAP